MYKTNRLYQYSVFVFSFGMRTVPVVNYRTKKLRRSRPDRPGKRIEIPESFIVGRSRRPSKTRRNSTTVNRTKNTLKAIDPTVPLLSFFTSAPFEKPRVCCSDLLPTETFPRPGNVVDFSCGVLKVSRFSDKITHSIAPNTGRL